MRTAILPEDHLFGAVTADGDAANSGDSNGLSRVVDGGGGRVWISRERHELLDLVRIGAPRDGSKLQHLVGVRAGRI